MTEAQTKVRKRQLGQEDAETQVGLPGEVDLAATAVVAFSSEDPSCPVEHMLDGTYGPGASRWLSARPDMTEQLLFDFDGPQRISRLVYEVEEAERERTQEVRVEVSTDGGESFRQILAQDYTFSPNGATFQHEDLRFEIEGATHLRLTIVPHKNGAGTATLTSLRICA